MYPIRRMVEIALYGIGDQRRFVQDGPAFPEVWIALLENARRPVSILIQPYMDLPPSRLAEALSNRGMTRRRHQLVYNNTLVSMKADLETIVFGLAPLSQCFQWISQVAWDSSDSHSILAAARLALSRNLWADLSLPSEAKRKPDSRIRKDFLSFVRMAGVVAYFTFDEAVDADLATHVEVELITAIQQSPEEGMKHIGALVAKGWGGLARHQGPVGYAEGPTQPCIYSITNDRNAYLAVAESRCTIKADAAQRLFDISCRGITWAVLDAGIDARHPAFLCHKEDESVDTGDVLPRSRVERTFDLSYLREVLLGDDDDQLPENYRSEGDHLRIAEARERADKFLPIDWGVLLPLLEVHGTANKTPINPHGTHVAGILGADWNADPRGDPMRGVCPDIRLIDIRVCKPDGSSDEFVITAALQFLRYLNTQADMMAVHGVNVSISLEHDVANYACGRTPVCLEAERTMSAGIVVVVAAGNRGYRHIKAGDESTFYQYCAVSITDPGNAAGVITVGSTHRREPHNFGVSYFSSRGPTGDGRIKPDLVAPGEKIYAPAPNRDALTLDGTSMAAPHVSGAAALILARNPELIGQPALVKQLLCDSATDLKRERYFQGHGLVDVLRALQSL